MTDDMIPVALDSPMEFECSAQNSCFNDCCRDLNQALTPYDVLRLKQALGIPSQDFLKTYTTLHFGPESGLPIVSFKPNPATGNACPFVQEQGCAVYADRPASCRMYPLARALARDRQTGSITEYFALIQEDHCKGFERRCDQTVAQWLHGQDVDVHNRENDKLMELIALKNQIRPGKLEGAQADIFYTALYDLDAFKDEITTQDVLVEAGVPEGVKQNILKDDLSLLNFSIAWVKHQLFGQDLDIDPWK